MSWCNIFDTTFLKYLWPIWGNKVNISDKGVGNRKWRWRNRVSWMKPLRINWRCFGRRPVCIQIIWNKMHHQMLRIVHLTLIVSGMTPLRAAISRLAFWICVHTANTASCKSLQLFVCLSMLLWRTTSHSQWWGGIVLHPVKFYLLRVQWQTTVICEYGLLIKTDATLFLRLTYSEQYRQPWQSLCGTFSCTSCRFCRIATYTHS